MSSTFYTCSEYPTAAILLASGTDVVEVPISYSYELDYVDQEEGRAKAIQHVETFLLNRLAHISNLKDCSDVQNTPFRHLFHSSHQEGNTELAGGEGGGIRRLRFKGRGYNSIIGISSNSMDTVVPNTSCQHSSNGGGSSIQESTQEVEEFNNGVSPDLAGSSVTGDVTEAESGGGEETERLEEDDGTVILEEIKVDGVVDATSVVRSALPAAAITKEEEEEDLPEGAAYNYWSTQQDIKEFESIQTQTSAGEILPGTSLSVSNVNMSPPKTRTGDTPEEGVSCNVIQGELTLFISKNADPFENLDGRIRVAIATAFTDPVILEQRFLNNEFIRDIHLLEPTLTTVDESAASPISSTVSSTSPSNGSGANNAGFASSNYAIGVIAALGAVFLALVGLFAFTSRPRKRRRLDDLSSCHDDTYSNELDAVSALFNGGKQQQSAKKWFEQEGALRSNDTTLSSRRDRNVETPVPTIEASFSDGGVCLQENLFAAEARTSDEEDDSVDMDAHLQLNSVGEDSEPRKAKKFGFLRKKRSLDSDDVAIDEEIVVEKVEEHSHVLIDDVFEDGFAIETTRRTSPLRPMAAYTSPTANTTRAHYCDRSIQKCDQSGILTCLPAPEITDEETISVLTDNNYYQSRGSCVPQGDGRPMTRAVTECVAPTDDRSVKSNQLARRQPQDNSMGAALTECWSPRNDDGGDAFAETSWNPFEGNFWQGWFE